MNYTKAAEEFHITQPAMSQAIGELEKECGAVLFIRDKNALKITEEGQILLSEINLILKQYDHLMYVVKGLSLQRDYVRIGLSTFSGNLVYPYMQKSFLQRYGDIKLFSSEESTKKQFEMLDDNLLDVIITTRRTDDIDEKFSRTYGFWPLLKTKPVFSVHKSHPLANQPSVTIEEMGQVPLVLLSDHFNQTIRLKHMFQKAGIHPNIIHYTNQMYSVERFIESNIGAGFLPDSRAEKNPDIVGLEYPDGTEQLVQLFWRKDRYRFTATQNFINLAKELYPKQKT